MAIRDFRSQRLFVDHTLAHNTPFAATREQSNYLLNVLRLSTGSEILVFNGRDGEWRARIESTGRKNCNLGPIEQTRTQPPPSSLTYCFAPLKQARLDYMIQKAVEMGAGILQPVITQYTQVSRVKHERVLANAIEAAQQCGILGIPEIRQPIKLDELQGAISGSILVFCDETSSGVSGIDEIDPLVQKKLALLIGPEGGFSEAEREFLKSLDNTVLLGLGPRILRADTAAVAALAVLQSRIGDWYSKTSK